MGTSVSPQDTYEDNVRTNRFYYVRAIILGIGLLVIVGATFALMFSLLNSGLETPDTALEPTYDAEEVAALSPVEIGEMLLRSGVGPEGVPLDVLYAPTWYFHWNKRNLPDIDQPVIAFFVMETIHDGVLYLDPPAMVLKVGRELYEPLDSHIVSDAPHHRASQVLFALNDENGQPIITADSKEIVLAAPVDGRLSSGNVFRWQLPLPYGLGILDPAVIGTGSGYTVHTRLTWAGFLAIMGGMLTALSPCLLQLAVYYAALLASAGAEVSTSTMAKGATIKAARGRLMQVSLFFVGGFTLVYSAGGFAAGYVGQSLENLSGLEQWYRPVSFVSGVIIIALAFRVALQSRAPLVCRLPIRVSKRTGWKSSALMGLSFAIGCTSCFSATVLSALLIYVGSTGSPLLGALILFLFSSGVGAIFLMAAWVMGEAAPQFADWLYKAQPIIGGLSALVMVMFGILMMTYEFHTVSGWLFQLFSAR